MSFATAAASLAERARLPDFVIRAGMRLLFSSTCSIASGMPWPRMAADP